MLRAIVLPLLIVGAAAQVRLPGPCNITAIEDFDVTRYMGWWYEFAHYHMDGPTTVCGRNRLILNPDGTMTTQVVFYFGNDTEPTSANLSTTIDGCTVIDTAPGLPTFAGTNLTMISMDYTSYYVAGNCVEDGEMNTSWYWIFLRQPFPTLQTIIDVAKVILDNNIAVEYFVEIDEPYCIGRFPDE